MTSQDKKEVNFQIQRLYIKDISFETPNSPKIFQEEWRPEVKLDLNSTVTELDGDFREVVLQLTVTVSLGETVAFLCQVQQAGIFIISGFSGDELAHCLGSYCPTILFPYARECISNLVCRGTFPPLNLAPINFDALLEDYARGVKDSADNPAS